MFQDLFFETLPSDPGKSSAEEISDESLTSALNKIEVRVEIEQKLDGLRLSRFRLILSGVHDYNKLRRNIDDLNFILGLSANSITFELGGGERRIVLDVPRPMSVWRYITWTEAWTALDEKPYNLPVCLATDVLGAPITFDLTLAPHLLIGGTTGSGKSICVHAIILSLFKCAKWPELVLVDAKAVELTAYDQCQFLRGGRVITDMADAKVVFQELVETMDQRQKAYMSIGARDIKEALQKGIEDRHIVVVVDELADLIIGKPGGR